MIIPQLEMIELPSLDLKLPSLNLDVQPLKLEPLPMLDMLPLPELELNIQELVLEPLRLELELTIIDIAPLCLDDTFSEKL